jgi:hypothetical protein
MSTTSVSSNILTILQNSYSTPSQFPPGSKFAKVDPTQWQGTWTATDSNGKPVTLAISNVSGYRANVRFTTADGGLQTGRVLINTNGVFRIGDSQMQLTAAGKMTISTVITDSTTGNQSMETDHATLQSGS